MHYKLLIASAAAALISTVAGADCSGGEEQGNGYHRYTVRAYGQINDVSGICGGLWDNLNAFGQCYQVYNLHCGSDETGAGATLEWQLTVADACDGGCIESAWYEATQNNYGSISCQS